jgi:hypothetical protein
MAKNTNYSPTFPMYPGGAIAVVPSNSVNLAYPSVIYVGGAGNVTVVTAQGDVVTFTAPAVGSVLPVQVTRVNATGTTATALVAIY